MWCSRCQSTKVRKPAVRRSVCHQVLVSGRKILSVQLRNIMSLLTLAVREHQEALWIDRTLQTLSLKADCLLEPVLTTGIFMFIPVIVSLIHQEIPKTEVGS